MKLNSTWAAVASTVPLWVCVPSALAQAASEIVEGAVAAPAAHASAPAPAATLPTVVITGATVQRELSTAPYAITVVDRDDLRAAGPMVNLSESLSGRVPGLVVANRNNFAQDLQISSRGFGARAGFGVRGLRLYTDGIPASMPDGQGQVSHFDLAGAERVEVLRGPFSVLYGNSSGGVIALFSQAAVDRLAGIDLDVGSFGLRQWRVHAEAPLGDGWDIRASVSGLETDGSRAHAAADRQSGNVRLGWRGELDSVTLLASAMSQDAQDPLGLTRSLWDANPKQTAMQATMFNTRKTLRQQQVGGRWEHHFPAAQVLSRSVITAYGGHREVGQWLAIPAATQAGANHGGGVIDFSREYAGVDARLVWQFGERAEVVTGVSLDTQSDDRQGYENFIGTPPTQQLGVTGRLRRDELNKASTRDMYAQGELKITPNVQMTLGLRSGQVRFEADDRYLANGDDSGSLRFNYTNPVLGLRWTASPGLNLYASVGRGFEAPTLNELAYRPSGAGAGFNTALRPQTSDQFEVGARYSEGDVSAEVSVFHIDSDDELGVLTNAGGRSTFQNVGSTRRVGAELAAGWRITPRLNWQVALAWLDARYRNDFLTCGGTPCTSANVVVPAGNRIAGTFGRSLFTEVAWRPFLGQPTQLALEVRGQGKTWVNDVNNDAAPGFGVASLRASHHWPLGDGQRLELLARVDNVTDRRYAGSVIVNEGNGRYFEPAPGRTGSLSVRWQSMW